MQTPNQTLNIKNTQIISNPEYFGMYLQVKCKIKMLSFDPTENDINGE